MSLQHPSENKDTTNNISGYEFSATHLQSYISRHWPSLQFEKTYTAPKYEGIPMDNPMQRVMTKAVFRSKKHPDITAESGIDIANYIDDTMSFSQEKPSHEDIQKSIYDWLASSGHRELLKKELKYKAALVKKDLQTVKKEWLQDNNMSIKDVSVDVLRGDNYVYYVTLTNNTTDIKVSGSSRQDVFEKAINRAAKEKITIQNKKKGMLDVTHLSTKSIMAILDGKNEDMHEIYTTALYTEIGEQIESGCELTFTREQIEDFKKYCIDTEQYEMALKVKNYLGLDHER